MAYTLQQLSDFEDIRTIKHRYFRAIDTADMALLEPLFTEDVSVTYNGGTYRVKLTGKAAMLEFLANSFHSGALAMHHGHMPDIRLTGDNTAEGKWYLEDVFINIEDNTYTFGTAIYTDLYRREGGTWKIARTDYDRVIETITPIDPAMRITTHLLARVGRKPEERTDISHLIEWDQLA